MKDNNTKMDIMENVDLIANNSTYDCQQQMPNGDRDTADFNMTASMDDSMVDELTKNMANIGNEQISSDGGNNERSVTPSPANVQGLPYKELCEQLRHQLEYYFSYKNLSKDQYLVSQMDDEQYVAISIVANFDKIRRLTNDLDLVVQVLRDSTEVTVDETGTKVKPNSKRRVVILRDVPVEITRDTIIKIFEESKCPVKLEKCESTHNQSYYLYFHGDEDAQKAMTYLRDDLVYYPTTQIPILARIKAKPTVRHHTNQTNTNPVLGPNGKPNTVVLGAPMPVPPHNVISPIGIVTAPSPVGSTISSHSAAVSPVSSMSGSFINASNQQPNHSTTTVLLPTSATIPGGPPGTAESTLNAIPYPNAANVYPYNVPPLTRVYPPTPFYAPIMTSISNAYDLSTVFVANGLAPHYTPNSNVGMTGSTTGHSGGPTPPPGSVCIPQAIFIPTTTNCQIVNGNHVIGASNNGVGSAPPGVISANGNSEFNTVQMVAPMLNPSNGGGNHRYSFGYATPSSNVGQPYAHHNSSYQSSYMKSHGSQSHHRGGGGGYGANNGANMSGNGKPYRGGNGYNSNKYNNSGGGGGSSYGQHHHNSSNSHHGGNYGGHHGSNQSHYHQQQQQPLPSSSAMTSAVGQSSSGNNGSNNNNTTTPTQSSSSQTHPMAGNSIDTTINNKISSSTSLSNKSSAANHHQSSKSNPSTSSSSSSTYPNNNNKVVQSSSNHNHSNAASSENNSNNNNNNFTSNLVPHSSSSSNWNNKSNVDKSSMKEEQQTTTRNTQATIPNSSNRSVNQQTVINNNNSGQCPTNTSNRNMSSSSSSSSSSNTKQTYNSGMPQQTSNTTRANSSNQSSPYRSNSNSSKSSDRNSGGSNINDSTNNRPEKSSRYPRNSSSAGNSGKSSYNNNNNRGSGGSGSSNRNGSGHGHHQHNHHHHQQQPNSTVATEQSFDLLANAFPPLPGIISDDQQTNMSTTVQTSDSMSKDSSDVNRTTPNVPNTSISSSSEHHSKSTKHHDSMADVVKGQSGDNVYIIGDHNQSCPPLSSSSSSSISHEHNGATTFSSSSSSSTTTTTISAATTTNNRSNTNTNTATSHNNRKQQQTSFSNITNGESKTINGNIVTMNKGQGKSSLTTTISNDINLSVKDSDSCHGSFEQPVSSATTNIKSSLVNNPNKKTVQLQNSIESINSNNSSLDNGTNGYMDCEHSQSALSKLTYSQIAKRGKMETTADTASTMNNNSNTIFIDTMNDSNNNNSPLCNVSGGNVPSSASSSSSSSSLIATNNIPRSATTNSSASTNALSHTLVK
ncbi:La- protein 4 [Dermatophagoides pteronyssinus]|nr:La- protein 4 [Dermatophagoides pteronyssinus]